MRLGAARVDVPKCTDCTSLVRSIQGRNFRLRTQLIVFENSALLVGRFHIEAVGEQVCQFSLLLAKLPNFAFSVVVYLRKKTYAGQT